MPIYDSEVQPLMQQFMASNEAEGVAIKALLAYMQGGGNDIGQLKQLTDAMTSTHDNKMKIYAQMQQFRLDAMQNIHIVWAGPYSHAEALQLNSPSDFGLYQYYGDHHVYGNSALLYIGKAQDQTFGRRLSQHNWEVWVSSNIAIYIGKVYSDESLELEEWRRQIDLAERILLQSHSPSFNSSNLNSIGHKAEDTRVLNWGARMKLLPEVSISRWEGPFAVGNKLKAIFFSQSRPPVPG